MIISTVGVCTAMVSALRIPLLSESPRQVMLYVWIFHVLLGFDVLAMECF